MTTEKLSEQFFQRDCRTVARELLGSDLRTAEGLHGRIVETEAYLGEDDPAAHYTASGTKRDRIIERGAGIVYVFSMHGHHCFNFITEHKGTLGCVLLRALEPLEGVEKMKLRRNNGKLEDLCSGPGKLTEAMGISRQEHSGQNIRDSHLSVEQRQKASEIETTPRIGISEAEEWPLRFVIEGSDFASR